MQINEQTAKILSEIYFEIPETKDNLVIKEKILKILETFIEKEIEKIIKETERVLQCQ